MSATVDVGTGVTLTAGTSSWSASIIGMQPFSASVNVFNTSHAGTAAVGAAEIGNATYIAGRIEDAGELTVEVLYNPDTVPPIGTSETWTVQFPASGGDSTGASLAGTGIMTALTPTVPLGESEDKMTASVTVKWAGAITLTAGA